MLDQVQQEELREVLWAVVDSLPDRQPKVLRMRYQEGKTLRETGRAIGVSKERVRVIENKALHKLRTSGRARELRPFLPEYVEGMAWKKIADKMGYSQQHIYRIHNRAIGSIVPH